MLRSLKMKGREMISRWDKGWMFVKTFWLQGLKIRKIQKDLALLYRDVATYSISKQYRLEYEPDTPDLIYGELAISDFIYLLGLIPIQKNCLCFDLGCGDSQLLISAMLFYKQMKFYGIEKIPALYDIGMTMIKQAQDRFSVSDQRVYLELKDFLTIDMSRADIIYVNAAALTDKTWITLNRRFETLEPNTYIIVVERKVISPNFKCLYSAKHKASWGNALVHIYVKD